MSATKGCASNTLSRPQRAAVLETVLVLRHRVTHDAGIETTRHRRTRLIPQPMRGDAGPRSAWGSAAGVVYGHSLTRALWEALGHACAACGSRLLRFVVGLSSCTVVRLYGCYSRADAPKPALRRSATMPQWVLPSPVQMRTNLGDQMFGHPGFSTSKWLSVWMFWPLPVQVFDHLDIWTSGGLCCSYVYLDDS